MAKGDPDKREGSGPGVPAPPPKPSLSTDPAEDAEASLLAGLNEEDLKALGVTLKDLINHIAPRIVYAEARRANVVTFAGAFLAASIALLAFAQNSIRLIPLQVALTVFSILNGVTVILMLIVYSRQTNFRYPFRGISGTWKWFYASALKNEKAFGTTIFAGLSKSDRTTAEQEYKNQWEEFKKKQISGLTNLRTSVIQDLKQVYLLHVNERYKNIFLTSLRRIFSWGIGAGLVLSVASAIASYTFPSSPLVTHRSTLGQLASELSWRETGKTRSSGTGELETQLLINLRFKNSGLAPIQLTQIIAKDNVGMKLPIYTESLTPTPIKIDAGQTSDAIAIIWLSTALRSSLDQIEGAP